MPGQVIVTVKTDVSHPIESDDFYILAPNKDGKVWCWRGYPGGIISDKREHNNFSECMYTRGIAGRLASFHFLDPVTAISFGLIAIEELTGRYPEGFIALLNLLKVN